MSRVVFNLDFEHNYSAREVEDYDLPTAAAPIYEFKDAPAPLLMTSWLALLISPADGPEWIGRFAIAYGVPPAINGVYSTPSPDRVCVVGGGQGFVIDVINPKNYEIVHCYPITSVAHSSTTSRLVFADFTALEAWDANGKVWDSGRIALDELEIVRIDANSLFCRCRGVGLSYHFEFDVDLMNGSIIGGGRRMIASDNSAGSAAIDHFGYDIELESLRQHFS